jgi:hypothetical protein
MRLFFMLGILCIFMFLRKFLSFLCNCIIFTTFHEFKLLYKCSCISSVFTCNFTSVLLCLPQKFPIFISQPHFFLLQLFRSSSSTCLISQEFGHELSTFPGNAI